MSPCTACLPRPIPLSSPPPLRWARAALDAGARFGHVVAPLAARLADRSGAALLRWFAHGGVVHLRPAAGWDGRFRVAEADAPAATRAPSAGDRSRSASRRAVPTPLRPQDWAALDDRLLRDIGLSDWLRARAAARRELDQAFGALGGLHADESTTRTARGGW